MGRPRKPAHLKLVTGRGDGRDAGGRVVEHGPMFRRRAPEPPDSLDGEARAEWNRIVPVLEAMGILKPEDRALLVAYCRTWALFREASNYLEAEGLFIEARQGLIPHPAVAIQNSSARQLRALASQFGLSPLTEALFARVPRHDEPTAFD